MATSPSRGERRSSAQTFRRSSSQFAQLPPQRSLSFHEQAALDRSDAAEQVLYSHPNVKIYAFSPPTDAIKDLKAKRLPEADYPIDAIEVLPWRSRTENLVSSGPIVIEKVRGSLNFLKAGNVVNGIMRNSQCWCVDGESRFVMRIGNLRYQRLEFPSTSGEDKEKVQEFKEVLAKILKFERTPCPFIRAFHVDLPEDAITPRRKGTWKRKEGLTPTTPDNDLDILRRRKTTRAWSFKGPPPNAFPTRSFTYSDAERPRTASTSAISRFQYDVRTDSPLSFNSGDEGTDSDRRDSGSEKPDSSHNSEVEESDKEVITQISSTPVLKAPFRSPLKTVEVARPPTVDQRVQAYEEKKKSEREKPTRNLTIISNLPNRPEEFTKHRLTFENGQSSSDEHDPPSPADTLYNRLLEEVRSPPPRQMSVGNEEEVPTLDLPAALDQPGSETATSSHLAHLLDDRSGFSTPSRAGSVTRVCISSSRASTPLQSNFATLKNTSQDQTEPSRNPDTIDDAASIMSSDSFHTMASEMPVIEDEAGLPKRRSHRRDTSDMTITEANFASPRPLTQTDEGLQSSGNSTDVHATNQAQNDEIRQRLQSRRSLSPMPASRNLAISATADQQHVVASALIQKAATLAVVKPIEVALFFAHILARIAGGATVNDLISGDLFRRPGTEPGRFVPRPPPDPSETDRVQSTNHAHDSDQEDDYGLPLRRHSSISDLRMPGGASW